MSAITSSMASTVPLLQLKSSKKTVSNILNKAADKIPTAVSAADSALAGAASNMTGASLLASLQKANVIGKAGPANNTQTIATSFAEKKLQQPPFAPKDVNMFTTGIYPEGTPEVAATAKGGGNIGSLKAGYPTLLTTTLAKRFGKGTEGYKQALAVYNDPELHQLTAQRDANGQPILGSDGNVKFDQKLMSSLALLSGTAGEGSIDAFKNGPYARIAFGKPSNPSFLAESRPITGTNYNEVLINQEFKYEDPRLLTPLLAHESLHQDAGTANSNREELMANSVEAAVYGQLVAESPALARRGTTLSRNENTKLMALLNTRDAKGHINIMGPSQGPIFPGSTVTNIKSFGEGFVAGGLGPNTPGNGSLDSVLSSLSGHRVRGANFNNASLNTLNKNINNALKPQQWVRAARALKLDLSKPKA